MTTWPVLIEFDFCPDGGGESIRVAPAGNPDGWPSTVTSDQINPERAQALADLGCLGPAE